MEPAGNLGSPMTTMSPDTIQFIADIATAGFTGIANVGPQAGGIGADCIRGGEPCRVTLINGAWSAWLDTYEARTPDASDARGLSDEVDMLIAISSPESRTCFAFDAIRDIVTRHVDYSSATEEQAKAAESALAALEAAFGIA